MISYSVENADQRRSGFPHFWTVDCLALLVLWIPGFVAIRCFWIAGSLACIAGAAQELNIRYVVQATGRQRDDMVEVLF